MMSFNAFFGITKETAPVVNFVDTIEQVEITFGTGDTVKTATITAVDTARTVVFFDGWNVASDTTLPIVMSYLTLTNSTTVTATRNTSGVASTVRATVVQFKAGSVNSVQYGTISMGTSTLSNTATISAVDVSRSTALYLGNMTNDAANDRSSCDVTLTNATTVTTTRGDAFTSSVTVSFVVVEFSASFVNSVQQFSITIPSNQASQTAAITAVDTTKTMLFYKGNTLTAAQNPLNTYPVVELTNATTLTASRNTSSIVAVSLKVTVFEFTAAAISKIQRGQDTILASNGTQNITITSVNTSKAIANYCGFKTSAATTVEHEFFPTIKLLNATTAQLQRGTAASSNTITVSWEVIEFK